MSHALRKAPTISHRFDTGEHPMISTTQDQNETGNSSPLNTIVLVFCSSALLWAAIITGIKLL